jgi:hypothetical protein
MRPLEIALTLSLLLSVIALMSPSRSSGIGFTLVIFVILIIALCHVIVEGYRWQMLPNYLLTVLLLLYALFGYRFAANISYLAGFVSLCCVGVAVLLSTILPVFELPAPTGPYEIGTQIRHLVDRSRHEQFSDNPGDPRELMIQMWYPAETSSKGQISPYRERSTTTLWNARYALATTHSIIGASLSGAQQQYPLLIFAPSWCRHRPSIQLTGGAIL